jgi:putative membrane protein
LRRAILFSSWSDLISLESSVHKHLFAAAVAAAALIAVAGSPSAQDTKKEQKEQSAKKDSLQGSDRKMMQEIAQSDMAEVAAGKLAAGKAQSDEVKKFAQHMVDDHGKHLGDLRKMAKTKGVQLPASPAKKHQDAMKKLESASGAGFDKAFMEQMVKDHEEALKLAQNTAKNAKDKELKADAEKTAPVIQKHLEMAKSIVSNLK